MRLIVDSLSVRRGDRLILAGVSFSLEPGKAIVVIGPNGAGKSTLLKAIAGFLAPCSGAITLEGGSQGDTGEHCHYLGHENALKPSMTVSENLEFWQRFLGPGPAIEEVLETVGMSQTADLPAGYLSAGQKRRVAIARLLATRRPIWLVDEPTAALDHDSEVGFAQIANRFLDSGGLILAATHRSLSIANSEILEISVHSGASVT